MTEEEIIRQRVEDILKLYLWEFNDHRTRSEMVTHLQNTLFVNEGIEHMQVIDRTRVEDVDANRYVFVFLDKNTGIEHTLDSYINSLKVTADNEH